MTSTPLIAAILLLHVTLLSSLVSKRRIQLEISLGDGENSDMRRAVRAHANALEHAVPFILLLFFYESLTGPGEQAAATALWYGLGFVAARLLHSIGMLARVHRLRQLGATVSLLLELFVGVLLLRAAYALAPCPW